jgi:uncharacterized repeat protein (TIGR01451 family)
VQKGPGETGKAGQDVHAETSGRQEQAVRLEWSGPATLRVGVPASFQIIVRNVSSAPVYQVVVRHRLPQGVSTTASGPLPLSKDGEQLFWELGTLPPGQERRVDLHIVPSAKVALDLQATVTFTSQAGLHVPVYEPKLALKVTGPEHVMLGDPATLSVSVSNIGDASADHVKVRALLPEGLEHSRGRHVEVDLGTLAASEQRTVQLVCTTRATGPQRCEIVVFGDGNLKVESSAAVDILIPRLDVVMTGPHLRYQDRHAIYVIKATNPGSVPAGNVAIQAVVPHGLKFHAASTGGQLDPASATVSWLLGDVPPGQSREVTLNLNAASQGEYCVRATVCAARGVKTEAEVKTRVEGQSALQMELADADDPVEVGADTSYEIRVTNTGSKTETNLVLTCSLPAQMEFRGAKCAAGCRFHAEGREVIFEPLPRLAPKADVIYRVFVRGTAAGDLRFRARIRSDGLTEPVLREESTKVYSDDVGAH